MMTRSLTLLLLVASSVVNGRDFLGVRSAVDISTKIQGALNGMLGIGYGIDGSRLRSIRATSEPIFNVLPKNHHGRLSPAYFRYAVRRYFSQQHGWVIKGFEPRADNTSNPADFQGTLMQEKIPGYLEAVVEKKLSHEGFALQDLVTAVAAFEAFIFDEGIDTVETTYSLNFLDTNDHIKLAPTVSHLMASYFLIEQLGGEATNITRHWMQKKRLRKVHRHWPQILTLISDIISEDIWWQMHSQNPFFTTPGFYFEDVVRISQSFSEQFGKFSNFECHHMKEKLAELDVHGTGRVKLADFYRTSKGGKLHFVEPAEYLNAIGALDNSSEHLGPQVIIPNYITGPNNCISSPVYYDICCLNECDGIYHHLESRIKAPTSSARQIALIIEEGIATHPLLSSTAPIEPRNLSAPLRDMLQQVGTYHHDVIPLHGRLLAQWLHYAFPQECPYPHMSSEGSGWQTQSDWKKANLPEKITKEQMDKVIDSAAWLPAPSPDAGLEMWNMQEELIESSYSASPLSWRPHLLKSVQGLVLLSFSAILLKHFLSLMRVGSPCHGKAAKKIVEYDI